MGKDSYIGIDYGMGLTNRDPENMSFHYGIISCHEISGEALNDLEADYGEACCPKCDSKAMDYESFYNESSEEDQEAIEEWQYEEHECADYVCPDCQYVFGSESAFREEPLGFYYDSEKLRVHQSYDDSDLWILKSEYYTLCAYCSPCAPGAGFIMNQRKNGIKTYCLPADWFENEECPYTIYKVSDGSLVYAPKKKVHADE